MLLAVDAGNSNIVMGVFDEGICTHHWRVQTQSFLKNARLIDEIATALGSLTFHSAIISSVVPTATGPLAEAIKNIIRIEPIVLKASMNTGIALSTEKPKEVGTDLIANAVAAYDYFKEGCVVVDFGTATTIIVVKEPGALAGAAICAGLQTSIEALVGRAAQLSDFPIDVPPKATGSSTVEAMQSGLVLGHIAMVEGLVRRMREESGAEKVIATGGLSTLLARQTNIFDEVNPMLTLEGLRIIEKRG